ncbi:putative thiol oxidase [Helianthus anomalus]
MSFWDFYADVLSSQLAARMIPEASVRMETRESQMAFTTTCVSDFITLMHEAIAAASCLFGALAWFWRSRQKNQKYFHKPQPLKIV